jgi:hypothetical protein
VELAARVAGLRDEARLDERMHVLGRRVRVEQALALLREAREQGA